MVNPPKLPPGFLLGLTASIEAWAMLRHAMQRRHGQVGPALVQPSAERSQLPPVLLMRPGYCG